MHDTATERKPDDGDDHVDPAPTTEPEETGETQPEEKPAAAPGTEHQAKSDGDADDAKTRRQDCACKEIETAVNERLSTIKGKAGCRVAALSKVLAKECCDASQDGSHAFELSNDAIKTFKRNVEGIVLSKEYSERTGSHVFSIDIDNVSPLAAAALLSVLGRSIRI